MIDLAVEAVDADVLGDLPDHFHHGRLALARAEERKHVDRAIDRPIDVLVEQGFEIGGLAFIDRTMQRARKTPETMLCHLIWSLKLDFKRQRPRGVRIDAVPVAALQLFEAEIERFG